MENNEYIQKYNLASFGWDIFLITIVLASVVLLTLLTLERITAIRGYSDCYMQNYEKWGSCDLGVNPLYD